MAKLKERESKRLVVFISTPGFLFQFPNSFLCCEWKLEKKLAWENNYIFEELLKFIHNLLLAYLSIHFLFSLWHMLVESE